MKIPYRFDFNGDMKYRTVLSSLPEDYTYAMPAAKGRLYYLWNGTEILSQQLNRTPFFTEMVDVKCQQTTEIPFIVDDAQIFLFFMIRGQVTFQANDGNPIIVTRNNTFMISVYGSGRFTFKAEAGKHIAFIINIQRKWMLGKSVQYPQICTVLKENLDKLYFTMNQYRMDRKVKGWLTKIYNYPKKDKGGLEGHLIKYIGYILNYYDVRIQEEDTNLADELKIYIEENYCDPKLNVEMLAEKFSVTRFTLLNHFKRKYKVSVQKFYLRLRLTRARLLLKEGNSMTDIFYQVGFRDESSLRKALLRSSPNKK